MRCIRVPSRRVSRAVQTFAAISVAWHAVDPSVARSATPDAKAGPASRPALREWVEAGEFGPALNFARQAKSPADRDAALRSIAVAQSRAGAYDASLATAAEMANDVARGETVAAISGSGRGGGVIADFEPLIELITSTIQPPSWDDNGGPGALVPFPGGVYVDAAGVMRKVTTQEQGARLSRLRQEATHERVAEGVRRRSPMRKVSLPRLEREAQLALASGRPLDEEMFALAGLQRVEYILVYPESCDLVLAGPAGDWRVDELGRRVSVDNGRPVLRLDDVIVLLRQARKDPAMRFGCSITPSAEALARAQAYLNRHKAAPLKQSQTRAWLDGLREQLGRQQLGLEGVDPTTHVAQVLLEADYHMKLVGIGLEEGTRNVPSYLDSIVVEAGKPPSALSVLRWWFTLDYDALVATADRDGFQLRGQGVRVLSENELLTAMGDRVHTGQSDEPTGQFAQRFTKHFAALATKYPVYAELQNVFDLALVCAVIEAEGLAERAQWHMTLFGDTESFPLAAGRMPQTVESVINHRVLQRKHIVAAVSGGVHFDPGKIVRKAAIQVDADGRLDSERARSEPRAVERRAWWWD